MSLHTAELTRVLYEAPHGERLSQLSNSPRVGSARVTLRHIHPAVPQSHLLSIPIGAQHTPLQRLIRLVLLLEGLEGLGWLVLLLEFLRVSLELP